MESYFDSKKEADCNGCGLCAVVCPQKCIDMVEDMAGFYYPTIDENKCIHCNKCRTLCSNLNTNYFENVKTYATINKSSEDIKKSSSGGMYILLAKYVIEKGGVVIGVEMDDTHNVKHTYAEKIDDCYKYCGSKYSRSDINGMYEKSMEFLQEDKYVLFTGTSCQVNAMKILADDKYDKLILCDILCHANPSNKTLKLYLNNIEKIYKKTVKKIEFRTKKNGWKDSTPLITFSNGDELYEVTYFLAFVRELISRDSCHSCVFASSKRISDFSIADLWGIENMNLPIKNDNTGISLLCVNTKKAQEIFNELSEKMISTSVDKELAFSYNHYCNKPPHKNRDNFFARLKSGEINEKNIIINMHSYCGDSIYIQYKKRLKAIVKRIIKRN